jgi:hypothetical protein
MVTARCGMFTCHCYRVEEIPPAVAAAVLRHYGCSAFTPGSMDATLIEAIVRMDPTNRGRAFQSFPGHVAAVDIASLHTDGIHQLAGIAGVMGRDNGLTSERVQAVVRDLTQAQRALDVLRALAAHPDQMLWHRADHGLNEALTALQEITQGLSAT